MRKLQRRRWPLAHTGSVLLVAVLALGASAAIAEVYAWRTEDGGYAFTDDPDAIPARYQDQVTTRGSRGLDSYSRFTPQDSKATNEHAERVAERLERLRRFNASGAESSLQPAGSRGTRARSISVSTGRRDAQRIDIATEGDGGPLVVERVRTIGAGKATTNHSTLVKQDGKVVAIIKGRSRETNLSDFIDEEDLADQ